MPELSPQDSSDHTDIARKAKKGCEDAFAEIFDRFYPEIFGFVTNQSENSDLDIADLTQLIFVKAARKIHQLKQPQHLRAWLYQIARNSIHDARRKNSRDQKLHLALVEEKSTTPHLVPASHNTAESIYDWMDQLDDASREAISLVYLQGLNHREASQVMGCAEGTISWRVSEAVKTLRQIAETERKSAT